MYSCSYTISSNTDGICSSLHVATDLSDVQRVGEEGAKLSRTVCELKCS